MIFFFFSGYEVCVLHFPDIGSYKIMPEKKKDKFFISPFMMLAFISGRFVWKVSAADKQPN